MSPGGAVAPRRARGLVAATATSHGDGVSPAGWTPGSEEISGVEASEAEETLGAEGLSGAKGASGAEETSGTEEVEETSVADGMEEASGAEGAEETSGAEDGAAADGDESRSVSARGRSALSTRRATRRAPPWSARPARAAAQR